MTSLNVNINVGDLAEIINYQYLVTVGEGKKLILIQANKASFKEHRKENCSYNPHLLVCSILLCYFFTS